MLKLSHVVTLLLKRRLDLPKYSLSHNLLSKLFSLSLKSPYYLFTLDQHLCQQCSHIHCMQVLIKKASLIERFCCFYIPSLPELNTFIKVLHERIYPKHFDIQYDLSKNFGGNKNKKYHKIKAFTIVNLIKIKLCSTC